MPSSSSSEIICVGLIVADHVCSPIPNFPPPGSLQTTPHMELTIGGCAANVSADLAKLGRSVSLVGRVGDDVFGRFVVDQLGSVGVNCYDISVSESEQTATTMIVNIENEDRRFIHVVGANTELNGTEVTDAALETAKILYVGGFGLNKALSGERVSALFERARAHNVTTVLDVVLDDVPACCAMLGSALKQTDLFMPNSDEATALTNQNQMELAANEFLQAGAKTVVITRGGNGVILKSKDGTVIELPAHNVTQLDGTGGGDAFVAGYLHGLIENKSPRDCLQFGSAMGASCVQTTGATTGVFNAEQLAEFVREHPLQEVTR